MWESALAGLVFLVLVDYKCISVCAFLLVSLDGFLPSSCILVAICCHNLDFWRDGIGL